jgi:hypothetical protein
MVLACGSKVLYDSLLLVFALWAKTSNNKDIRYRSAEG